MGLFYPPTINGLQKTLDAQLDTGHTATITLNNTTGIQDKPGVIVLNRVDVDGNELPSAVREFVSYTGTSGNTLVGLARGLGGSTDQDHAIGSIVEFVPDITVFQAFCDALDGTDTDGISPHVIKTDTIEEKTPDAGVMADGVLLKDGEVITDTIKEATGGAGVDVDGRLIKDGLSGFVGQTILGSPGTSIVVSGLNTNKKLHISFSVGTTAGAFAPLLRFNGDTGNNYTYTRKHNDDALVTATGQAGIEVWSANTRSFLFDFDVYFDDVSDVWVVKWTGVRGTGSAAAAVSLNWGAGLWASNSNITSIAISGANNMPIGSSLTVIEY